MLETLSIDTSPDIHQAVIWLHGLGADGQDFVPVVDQLGLRHTRFIFPHAPYRAVTLNQGYTMRAWFDIVGLAAQDPQDAAGMQAMAQSIQALIQQQVQTGIPYHRIALAGFSQGGAMAAYTALLYPERLAGLLMLSSYLPLKDRLLQQAHPANLGCPIWACHGTQDAVIEWATFQHYCQQLQQAGYHVQAKDYVMGHQVCDAEIAAIADFLKQIFSPAMG